ncbi:Snf2 domain protein [Thalictrum thalictroides]|uniref:Snf2 domain protein n=1 Tax=Thalictrum thalictroides TaxID=46969 RepID=A0A7J6X4G1_THATH|nr:Snf2 domain protein [Thalictrum thalictroides]
MALVSVRSSTPTQASNGLIGGNYEIMLKESIERFLTEIRKGISDFSGISSIFFRLLQTRVDPPLETIWFYSAVRFRSSNEVEEEKKDDILSRIVRVKDLFQLLTSCSASCNGLKSVAVICPVLFELYGIIVELWGKKLLKKVEKKAMKESECLVEGVLSYVSLCGCEDFGGEDVLENLLPCFTELIRVWTMDQLKGDEDISRSLKVFFPIVSEEIRDGFSKREFGVSYLVGVVIVQAFLLRLCLKLRAGHGLPKIDLQKELTAWAVGSVTAFRNCCFFDILLRLLLESTLPITSLLDPKDEALLRKVLYDVVILVEYSFLSNEKFAVASNCMRRLAVRRLLVAHQAIQDARENGDQTKAISYTNSLSGSSLFSKLIKWVTSEIGMRTNKPNVTTPQALLKWLLSSEELGVRVFDDSTLKLRAKLVLDESKANYEHQLLKPNSNVEDDLLFYIDNNREEKADDDEEMVESMDAALTVADKKRKKGRKAKDKAKVKFVKYQLQESSVKEKSVAPPAHADDSSSDSDSDNIKDMEE